MVQLQVLTLIACTINICSAGEEKTGKKCPPEDLDLQPLDLKSIEDYKDLFGNWKVQKCLYDLYCKDLHCIEFTYAKGDSDKDILSVGSAYNQSSNKIWAYHGFMSLMEPTGLQLKASDKRANGKFHLLALTKKAYIFVACFEDNSFGAWISTKGKKFEVCDLLEMKEKAEKFGLNWKDFKEPPNEDCEKKMEGFR